jgi:hypothetical protein
MTYLAMDYLFYATALIAFALRFRKLLQLVALVRSQVIYPAELRARIGKR